MASAPIRVGPPPTIDDAFLQALDAFEATVAAVPSGGWEDVSPCDGWTVRDVVGHVVGSTAKVAALVRGDEYRRDDAAASNALGDDPVAAWREVSGPAREAVRDGDLDRETDAMHGRRTVAGALSFPVADLAVHAWDVAHAGGRHVDLPPGLLAHVVHTCEQVPEDVLRGPGLFGRAVPVADGADDTNDTTRLMAWLGRDTGR